MSTISTLAAAAESCPVARMALADALAEGLQVTAEGALCVTVARDGTNMASFRIGGRRVSVPVYVTAIYRASRRVDGVLTWRRYDSVGDTTSGHEVSAPMVARAKAIAAERGLPYRAGIRHGRICD